MGAMRTQQHHGVTWVDIGNPTRKEIGELATAYSFHPVHLEESLLTGHLPQVEREKDYVFLLLHMPGTDAAGNVVSDQLAVFLGKNYLVTLHKGAKDELSKLFVQCERDEQLREAYFRRSAGYLLYHLLDGLFKNTSEIVQDILEELDEIEGVVFAEKETASYEIGQLRQKITKLRRLTDFLKEILGDLAGDISKFTGEDLSRQYRGVVKTVNRLVVALDEAKETVEIFKDADFTASSAKTNQVLAVLTIIFTLTIPATILGTFYGMNIPLPGGIEDGAWMFLGPYTTFALVLTVSTVLAFMMAWYFWKRRWF